jgi:hypothetical protein
MVWGRLTEEDLASALRCQADIVHLSIPVSDIHLQHKLRQSRQWVLTQVTRIIDLAVASGRTISLGAEDASRADAEFLALVARRAQACGASRIRFADTLGVLDPFTTYEAVSRLREAVDIEIEIHSHNDLGLATANTLAALRAGASHANTTVNGLGERAGNAALEEVVMGVRHLHHADTGVDTQALVPISRLVARASGRQVAFNKSIVGEAVFTHESGIHIDGCLKMPLPTRVLTRQNWVASAGPCWASTPAHRRCARPTGNSAWRWMTTHSRHACWPAFATMPCASSKRQPQMNCVVFGCSPLNCKPPRFPFNRDPGGPLMESFLQQLKALSSAEDFLLYFGVPFEQSVVNVSRLHILKRFFQYIRQENLLAQTNEVGLYTQYREQLVKAYADFVKSTPAQEKVFKVFQDVGGRQHVSLDSLKSSLPRRALA